MTRTLYLTVFTLVCWLACKPPVNDPQPQSPLIARGRDIFFNETFDGNGRTCGTCHPAENNFTLDPTFIATLADNNALFVSDFNPALQKNFENTKLIRAFALIRENQDGFERLDSVFTLRGVPHTLGLRHSVSSPQGPHTGWSGDGAPGDATLRSFATGAVIQHFTKTLSRIPGVDFRLPTDEELDALEAFQLSLGRQDELTLPLPLKNVVALRGQALFNDSTIGKCSLCHLNAGANANPAFFPGGGNQNFNTGVEDLADQPADLTAELVPPDDGLGIPGDSTFNVPSLIEAADTGPFFHNNSVETIEGAVAFYDGEAFNGSPAAGLLQELTGSALELDATQIVAIAAFLRVINVLENINQARGFLTSFETRVFSGNVEFRKLPEAAQNEIKHSIDVLKSGKLHPRAVEHLDKAAKLIAAAKGNTQSMQEALRELDLAKADMIDN